MRDKLTASVIWYTLHSSKTYGWVRGQLGLVVGGAASGRNISVINFTNKLDLNSHISSLRLSASWDIKLVQHYHTFEGWFLAE